LFFRFIVDTPHFNEKQLLADIDHLRGQFTQTPDLYREVCVLLFFRYGITPTTNKLYQLVRKGSMSAPAEALSRFWEDLREKSRVRIEHPDLPESLKTAAGDLVASLWTSAQAAAQESLSALRSDVEAQASEARQAQSNAEAESARLRAAEEQASAKLEQASKRIAELEQSLAAANATVSSLETQLQAARGENAALLQKLEEARRDFSAELDKLRAAADLAEERFRASETRALLEIDRERTAAAKLRSELESVRSSAEQSAERHRTEFTTLQEQLGNYRQRVGQLEGNLNAISANRDLAVADLKAARGTLEERSAKMNALEAETVLLRGQLDLANVTVEKLQQAAKPPRAGRKAKSPESV
jgi:chromosome segregation ATPase